MSSIQKKRGALPWVSERIDYYDVDSLLISREGFTEFARLQGDEEITHDACEGSAWADCAVGQYFTSLSGRTLTYPESESFTNRLFAEVGEYIYTELGESNVATYPELVALLEQSAEVDA